MKAIKTLHPTDNINSFDEALMELLVKDLKVFKSTKGRFLCNNQRKYQNNPLVA